MTAQAGEILTYNESRFSMASQPLSDYLDNLNEKPKFVSPSTGLWRGYVGTWEVEDSKLYLTDLLCFVGDGRNEAGMEYLFPGQNKVFADWFSGSIRLPQGELLHYVHGGYNSVWEEDIFLKFVNGELIDSYVKDNRGMEFEEEIPF